MKKITVFLAFLFVILCFANKVFAESFVINNYDVKAVVEKNLEIHVEERINVHFTEPKHGIIREIPKINSSVDIDGKIYQNKIGIKKIRVNNKYTKFSNYDDLKIKIGDSDRTVFGNVTYVIKYDIVPKTNRQPNAFYFDIIGTKWATTIKNVNFQIDMPKEFEKENLKFHIGKIDTIGIDKNSLNYSVDNKTIKGSTLRHLEPNEGLTINLPVSRNYFAIEYDPIKEKNKCILTILICTFIPLYLWWFFGRDQAIIPVVNFRPPKNLNSALVGAISEERTNFKHINSLIFWLASKGFIKIHETGTQFYIYKLKEYNGKDYIINILMKAIFSDGFFSKVSLAKLGNSSDFYNACAEIRSYIDEKMKKIYDENSINVKSYILPVLSTIPLIFNIAYMSNDYSFDNLAFVLFVCPFMALLIYRTIRIKGWINRVFFGLMSSLFVIPFGYPILVAYPETDVKLVIINFIAYIVAVICIINLPKKNYAGLRLCGEILGFKKFIETAEKRQIEHIIKTEKDYCHKMIAYAYSLDVLEKWCDIMDSIQVSEVEWYSGNYRYTTFRTFAKTISKYSSRAGSHRSRGSSGGSFGGGCGGGGGRSW